jgi:hypothetical protein
MRVASHTLSIWLMRRAWKLLVHPLVITVLPSWWRAWWRVEGLLVIHLFHLVLLVMVILMSVIGKLVLVHCWRSRLQDLNSINDSSDGAFHPLKSHVGGLLVLYEKLSHRLHHGVNLLVANTFFFIISCWWWWWRLLSLFWRHGEQKTESNKTDYRLVKTKRKTEGGSTHSSVLPRSYKCSTYTTGGNRWPCEN